MKLLYCVKVLGNFDEKDGSYDGGNYNFSTMNRATRALKRFRAMGYFKNFDRHATKIQHMTFVIRKAK